MQKSGNAEGFVFEVGTVAGVTDALLQSILILSFGVVCLCDRMHIFCTHLLHLDLMFTYMATLLLFREHKVTQLLKECLSSLTCHAAMIAHVSPAAQHYTDTLATVQLASRIHRMRRRKIKVGTVTCVEHKHD
jgi:hypothetical protein